MNVLITRYLHISSLWYISLCSSGDGKLSADRTSDCMNQHTPYLHRLPSGAPAGCCCFLHHLCWHGEWHLHGPRAPLRLQNRKSTLLSDGHRRQNTSQLRSRDMRQRSENDNRGFQAEPKPLILHMESFYRVVCSTQCGEGFCTSSTWVHWEILDDICPDKPESQPLISQVDFSVLYLYRGWIRSIKTPESQIFNTPGSDIFCFFFVIPSTLKTDVFTNPWFQMHVDLIHTLFNGNSVWWRTWSCWQQWSCGAISTSL